MKLQVVYKANMDFEEVRNNLIRLGYNPHKEKAGRKSMEEAGVLTFQLHGNKVNVSPRVNVSPTGKYHAIQVSWKSIEEKEKHETELFGLLASSEETRVFGRKHSTILLKIPSRKDKEFLKEIEAIYSKYMRPYGDKDFLEELKLVETFMGLG